MNRKRRFKFTKPHIQLYDTTGLSQDVQKSLNTAILAVTFSMVFVNITSGAAWTGFQRMLGADSLTLGIISAIPVAASTMQIFASYCLEKWQKRRALLLVFGFVHRFTWVIIGLIPYLIPMDKASMRLMMLMVLLAVSAGGGSFLNVTFYSLITDLVPMRIRGRYFSARQAVSLLAGILAGLFVSWIMDAVDSHIAFTIVLVIAGIFGCLDICCFFNIHFPPMQEHKGKGESFGAMLRSVLSDRSYMKIVGYFTLWFFAVNISGPFGNVLFLEHARMTFTEITVYNQIIPNITTVLIIGWWGRQMDRYGNQPIVQLAGLYCMLLPLTYVFVGPRSFLILPFAHAISGMAWPASDIGQQNMYLAKAPGHNRSMYVAVFFTCTQLFGTALSNFLGGLLMSGPLIRLEELNWRVLGFQLSRYNYIFLVSGVLRFACVLGLLPHLRDVADTSAREVVRSIAHQVSGKAHGFWIGMRIKRLRQQYHKRHSKNKGANET